jgi:hypothetical protein
LEETLHLTAIILGVLTGIPLGLLIAVCAWALFRGAQYWRNGPPHRNAYRQKERRR